MNHRSRRAFLADVGKGMLVAGVGPALAADLGLATAFGAEEKAKALSFGDLEPLAALMQETEADKLLPIIVDKLKSGTELRSVVAAASLANARTFGGHNYDGYHAFMALAPSYHMAQDSTSERRALPVLKVLHRNCRFMNSSGGRSHEVLHEIEAGTIPAGESAGDAVRGLMRKGDLAGTEAAFAAVANRSPADAFNALQYLIEDEVDVHRVVLAWRSWAVLDLTGPEQARTLLRQSVHYCVESERNRINQGRPAPEVRSVLPKLLDQYKLVGRPAGTRKADDAWVEHLCQTIYEANRAKAAEAAAAALAEGFGPEDVAEAICLAANRLVLRDPGRVREEPGKPIGSVHGASVGVHASDSANAWRNIARVADARNAVASLVVAAFHTAGQAGQAGRAPLPWAEHLEAVKATDEKSLLGELESAIKAKDQSRAAAVAQRYGENGHASGAIFQMLMRFAISEDGALHAEKYYRTVAEEFALTRPAFRWRQLVALARVTASEYGFPAPGYAEACKLLKV